MMTKIDGFKVWERQCNHYMEKEHGVGIDDIPDMPWFDWYDMDELSPVEAVELAIEKVNEGGF